MWTFHYPPQVNLVGLLSLMTYSSYLRKMHFSPSEIAFSLLFSACSGTAIGRRWTSWFWYICLFFPISLMFSVFSHFYPIFWKASVFFVKFCLKDRILIFLKFLLDYVIISLFIVLVCFTRFNNFSYPFEDMRNFRNYLVIPSLFLFLWGWLACLSSYFSFTWQVSLMCLGPLYLLSCLRAALQTSGPGCLVVVLLWLQSVWTLLVLSFS